MFDISFAELALVFIIALVVLGPERLPKAARSVGHWMGRARAAFNHLKNELDREVVNQEMQDMFRQKADSLRKEVEQMNRSLNENLLEQNPANAKQHKTETGSAPQPAEPATEPPAGQAAAERDESETGSAPQPAKPATEPLAGQVTADPGEGGTGPVPTPAPADSTAKQDKA